MPCDRVNKIIEEDYSVIRLKTENCVHTDNWLNQGVEVALY